MTWYAIQTLPGAQMPQREYVVEPTSLDADGRPRGKGYRIVPSLNPEVSAVERALSDAGFVHYMPVEFQVIRDRKKTGTYKLRRFPLLKSYVFVTSCAGIRDVPGVRAIIGTEQAPHPVGILDILALRTIEARSQKAAQSELSNKVSQSQSEAKKTNKKAMSAARAKLAEGKRVKVLWGKEVGHEATLAGWEDDKRVRAILHDLDTADRAVLIPFDSVRLVA